jgi:inosine triphosphate pyrophosphatase
MRSTLPVVLIFSQIFSLFPTSILSFMCSSALSPAPVHLTVSASAACKMCTKGDQRPDSITFVTSNKLKIEEVKAILGEDFPWTLKFDGLDIEEPQATPIEISQAKCRIAAELVGGPVIVEDTSLCFNALNGLPGQYIKWFYEAVGNEGLAKMLSGFDDKSAYAECVLSFTLGKGEQVRSFVGIAEGSIVPPSTDAGFGWDPIFIPAGKDVTFAEMGKDEKNGMSHRYKAFRQFKAYVNSRMDSYSKDKMPTPVN